MLARNKKKTYKITSKTLLTFKIMIIDILNQIRNINNEDTAPCSNQKFVVPLTHHAS